MSLIPITDKSFKDLTDHILSNMSFLNLFNILEDQEDREKLLNIFRTYSLNEKVKGNTSFFETYEVDNDDWWDNIAYRFYGTPTLWWLIPLVNDVVNPFEEKLDPGQNLKIIRELYIYQLTKELRITSEM